MHHSKALCEHHMGHTKHVFMTSWDKEIIGESGPEDAVVWKHRCLMLEVHSPHLGAHSMTIEGHLMTGIKAWNSPGKL